MGAQVVIEIKKGDYIRSDFFSPIQGKVVGFGLLGKDIPCYKIRTPDGRIEYIVKGQAIQLWTKEEWDKPIKQRPVDYLERHDS